MTKEFDNVLYLLKRLRGENGCPWDKEQTIKTLKDNLESECKEVVEAIDNGDYANLKEEIGDLIWVLAFITQVAEDEKRFEMKDVLDAVSEKMVRRHPHVFGDVKAENPEDAHNAFLEAKKKEKSRV